MENINIQTAQNIDIQYNIASVGDRMLAILIDHLIFLGYALLIFFIFDQIGIYSQSLYILLIAIPIALYHLLCEVLMGGQSFGKKALKIKVVKIDGSSPSLGAYLMRWIFKIIEGSLFISSVIALVTVITNQKGQRLGDIAANTTVIKLEKDVDLTDTLFIPIPDDYKLQYQESRLLNEQDINTINDVLTYSKGKDENMLVMSLLYETKNNVAQKMDVQTDLPSQEFLKNILMDYNYLNKMG